MRHVIMFHNDFNISFAAFSLLCCINHFVCCCPGALYVYFLANVTVPGMKGVYSDVILLPIAAKIIINLIKHRVSWK